MLADELPRDVKITRVVGFDLTSRRPKMVGRNSRLDVHGDRATDRMVRLYTNNGLEGLGNCRASRDELEKLLGTALAELYRGDERRMTGPLGAGTMPLWDLAGKLLSKPVYELLGGEGPERVPVYDGSIYFADLLPQYTSRPLERFKEEVDMGFDRGHRAFKVKIGRGAKWMPAEEGYDRDVAVLRTIRQHAGQDVLVGVDANNGYSPERTRRLLTDLADFNFAFVEEMFPEQVDDCLALKRFIAEHGWKTLLADGETQHTLEPFKPLIEARAVDVLQGDMNHFGIEGILTEASWGREQGILVAPHNWGSLIGYYMQLHVGRAISNFYRAENDPLDTDVLIAEGYAIEDGHSSVPAAPGFGLAIDESKFASGVRIHFDLK
ncbi:MAG: mandelate racemase/muconate lactonizing enzyme family protein [Pirellulales bacterium]